MPVESDLHLHFAGERDRYFNQITCRTVRHHDIGHEVKAGSVGAPIAQVAQQALPQSARRHELGKVLRAEIL